MIRKKKLHIAILGLASINIYASDPWSFLNQGAAESQPLACVMPAQSQVEKSGPDYVGFPKVESQTLFLQADDITGQNKKTQIAQGNVVGYRGNQTISADWLIYDQQTSRVTAGDNMVLSRQYDTLNGELADYYFDVSKGTFTKAKVFLESANMTGVGQKIYVNDPSHMQIQNGYFTSCDPNNPAWYIQSQRIDLDYQNSEGTARGAMMYFESVPIFASPWMSFPLGQRKSGFLSPQFNSSATGGFNYSQPYYWNMAPNYDMTITPEYWGSQGFMLADQFRYMTENNVGSMYTEQMPNSFSNQYRWYWSLLDTYSPMQDVKLGYNYNQVSDGNYFNDFGNFYSVTDSVNLNQSVYANYAPAWGNAGIKLQSYQTLIPYGSSQTVPIYSSYPAVNFNVNPQDLGSGFKGSFISNYNYFYSQAMQSGQRVVMYPSVTYPLQTTWGYVTPKFGYNYTYYNIGPEPNVSGTAGQFNRGLPISSLDSGLYFDRPTSLGGSAYTQTFEPRIYYLYIPQNNQSNLPIFDTATATYNMNQLFSENRFSGFDRVNSANDITIGTTTRLINDSNGNEFMNLGVGYRYYVTPQNNFLYGNQTQDSQLFLPNPNFITELTNNWSKTIATTANFQYDAVYNNIDAYSAGIRITPDDYKVFNIRYRYQYQLPLLYYAWQPGQAYQQPQYENQYALDVSGQWPIYENKLFAIGRTNYDFTQQQPLNILGGVEYNGGCWKLSAVYEQFLIYTNPSSTLLVPQNQRMVYIQFTFNGIGGIGNGDPVNDLKIGIPGYMPVGQPPTFQVQ